MIKSFEVVFDKINAKIADSGKKCLVNVTDAYMISILPFYPKLSISSQCFRGNALLVETHLNVLQAPFIEILIPRKILRTAKAYECSFNTNFWQLGYRMYCNTEYIALGFDAPR